MDITITKAIRDKNLFKPFYGEELKSWRAWFAALKVLYGLRLTSTDQAVVKECTGLPPTQLSPNGYSTALFLTGRRSGKSRTAAIIGAFEAVLSGQEKKLDRGETGLVAVLAPTKKQAGNVKGYLRGVFETPMLQNEIVRETAEGFRLANNVEISVLAGDWRTVRGFTLLAAIVDEAAFFGYEVESKVRSDTELIRALKPSLATTEGRLVAITSPYARRGWCWTQYQKHFGTEGAKTLVWNCPSRTMNPLLPQSVVDEAMEEDLQSARSEYMGEFRDDVAEFVPRSMVERLVAKDRKELLPREETQYFAFADLSGGRGDDAALAIAHKQDKKVILDLLKRYRPPFNPSAVVELMAKELRRYGLKSVVGDNYAADFVTGSFSAHGIRYRKSEKPKGDLYTELLPVLCSDSVVLLDDPVLVNQIANLERRTRSGGKDIIDHPPGQNDDLANAVAGVVVEGTKKRIRIGVMR